MPSRKLFAELERWSVLIALPGALAIALNHPLSKYGFIFFIVSNILALVLFSLEKRRWFLIQTLIYFGINIIGVYRWLLNP